MVCLFGWLLVYVFEITVNGSFGMPILKLKTKSTLVFLAVIFAAFITHVLPASVPTKEEIKKNAIKFIPVSSLEDAGFSHISADSFEMLFEKDALYILCMTDRTIAKFIGNKPVKTFTGERGQGPQNMLAPKKIFPYDAGTIAVYDIHKREIIFFDRDLNYITEKRIKIMWSEIFLSSRGITAFTYGRDQVFAFLDKDFNIVENYVPANKNTPIDWYNSRYSNQGYFLRNGLLAHGFYKCPTKNCKVDIYDPVKKKFLVSLKWFQPNPPSKDDILNLRNMNFTMFVDKMKSYYVVGNLFTPKYGIPPQYDILVYNEKGDFIVKYQLPYEVISCKKQVDDMLIYVMDDDEDISYIDLETLLKKYPPKK